MWIDLKKVRLTFSIILANLQFSTYPLPCTARTRRGIKLYYWSMV